MTDPIRPTFLSRWHGVPLYARILGGVLLGVLVGLLLGARADWLGIPSKLVLQILGALAPPLILLAVVENLMQARIPGRQGARLAFLLLLNTLVAILIGLAVANVMQPGRWSKIEPPKPGHQEAGPQNPFLLFLDNIPKSLLGPLTDQGKVISVIILAVAFGIALRRLKQEPIGTVEQAVNVAFRTLLILLHWVIEVIPFAVFGIVASIVGVKGFRDFVALG